MSWSRSAVLIAALLAMSACAPATQPGGGSSTGNGAASAPQAPATPKRVVAAIPGSPTNFYQKFNLSSTIRGVEELEELVNSGFSILDAQGHSQARLAEQVPTLDNGLWKLLPDGTMETTWKIRQGAIWHDGTPVTAHDAVFAAQIGQDRDLPISRDLSYGSIQRIEEVDDHTVTVHWKAPYILADQQFSPRAALPLPSHLMEQAYRADKQSFLAQPFWADQWVGTGPFRIAEFVRDSHMVLTANDQFVLGRPKIDQIEMRFIVDPTTMIANVMAGTVDVTVGRGTSLEQAVQVRDTWRDGKVDLAVASFSQIFPQFINPNPAIVANLQFRRALLMALNRQEMVDSIQYGLVPVAHVFVSPDETEYPYLIDSVVKYDYDPPRATQMVQDLGYTKGPDGMFRDAAGQPLSVEVRATGTDLNQKNMHAAADYWRRIGVGAEEVAIPPQLASDLQYRATFPAFNAQRQGGEMAFVQSFHSSQRRLPEVRYAGSNNTGYSTPELDRLIDGYTTTIPFDERMRAAAAAARIITDQVVEMPLFYDSQPALISNKLVNIAAARGQSHMAWNADQWDVRQ